MKKTKLAFFHSVIALLLCVSMLVGTTFAWFTDSVSSANNLIIGGNLDVELEYLDASGNWKPLRENTNVFEQGTLWEPGHTEVVYLRVRNQGSLALKYQLGVNIASETGSKNVNGKDFKLSDYIYFGAIEGVETAFASRDAARAQVTNAQRISAGYSKTNSMKAGDLAQYVALVVYMPESVGNEANYAKDQTPPSIHLGITLIATQFTNENDSFGDDYDDQSSFPTLQLPGSISAPVTTVNDLVSQELTIADTEGNISAYIPTGVKVEPGTTELSFNISNMSSSGANITLQDNEILRSLDVHIAGVAADNAVPMRITIKQAMMIGLNMGNYKLYHVENGQANEMTYVASVSELTAHNQYTYDPATGDVTLSMATFSEVAAVADTENAWEGKFDYTWYDADATELTIANADQLAAFGAIVGGMNGQTRDSFAGKTVKLLADINLGDKDNANENLIFHPIGYYYTDDKNADGTTGDYYSTVYSFEGIFDGNGNKISNFYQNTWEIKGDYDGNYYKDAMGLFGYVYGGTVKNLTVDNFSSDGEFTPTGVIAAYAAGDATFENIAITNCNPRVYNTGNGGIIGIAGSTSTANDDHITLKNITVDNSNKISALWGSWDVACGGLVGMYRGNVDGSGNATGDTISFENCHVAAQIDVYNDVCANYQYYAYRYAGMIIGSIRHNTTNDEGKTIPNMEGISATGCTVNYGDWNDYYYCEFEKNSMASYSEDYQFSRVPHSELNFTDSNGNGVVDADERASVTGCKHTHTAEENHQAIYLPFHQLFTGYSWGVSSIGLEKYSGVVTNLDITEGDQNESVEKFATKFTGDFLYRVGNQNTVSIGSLFAAKDGVTISGAGVWVKVEAVDETMSVSGKFTASTTKNDNDTIKWESGTIQFSGTGVVKLTIQDYNFCKPTVLYLEVIDAVNATSATSATANNVVLLNDCGFSSLEVSGGYALYGNGFTMTCGSDSASLSFGAFVTLDSGTLDNVQIVCPNYDYAALYNSQLKDTDANRSETTNGTTRYYNAKSAVLATGNSQILNSRISGGRAALYASSGNIVVDNSRLELGAVATVIINAANSFVFRDVTLVQKPTVSTYDSAKMLMGMSVLYLCDEDGNATSTTLEGFFVQYAWADESSSTYMPEGTSSIVSTVLSKTNYTHTVNNNTCVNLGFAYMPNDGTTVNEPSNITDNRTNKNTIPYAYESVSATVSQSGFNVNISTYVYSYKNTNGTAESFKSESEYVSNKYSDIITVSYSDSTEGLTTGKSYGTDGWIYELFVDLDTASGYVLDFSKLSMTVNGVIVTDFLVNGSAKPTSPVAVVAGGTTYTLTATVNGTEYTATYKVTGTETSKDAPSVVASTYGSCLLVGEKGTSTTWSAAAPALEGIQIKYWSVAEKQYKTITLSNYTPATAGQQNGTNTSWTYTTADNDFTLTITNTTAVHSGNSVYAMPVVCNSKLYFVITSSNGLVSTSSGTRSIVLSYVFEDNNGGRLEFSNTFSATYSSSTTLYDYSDFCSGTLKEASGGCVTGDTLVTLADGTQKRIDALTGDEMLLVWDFYKGEYAVAPIGAVINHGYDEVNEVTMWFADGSSIKTLRGHGFFDVSENKFVIIDEYNIADYIGHEFVKYDANGNCTTTILMDYSVETTYTEIWTMVSAVHFNCILNGVLTLSPTEFENSPAYLMPFEIGEGMKYDEAKMQADIEKYGLYTYEDFADYVTYEQFVGFAFANWKVAVGKGYIKWEDIIYLINTYVNN